MTLNISATKISINNQYGQEKFNSNDKLVFLKHHYYRSNIAVTNQFIYLPWDFANYVDYTKDFVIVYVKFNSSNGSLISTIAGSGVYIPGNSTIPVHFYGYSYGNTYPAAEQEILSISLGKSNIMIKPVRFNDTIITEIAAETSHNIDILVDTYGYS